MGSLLLVILLNGGHWLSGHDSAVTVRWLADGAMPQATLKWELALGPGVVARGQADIDAPLGPAGKEIKIPVPAVRVRSPFEWRWKLFPRAGGNAVAEGAEKVYLYPGNQLEGIAKEVGEKKVVVYDASGGLSSVLGRAKVPFRRIEGLGALATLPADIILVGENQLGDGPFDQQPLTAAAEAGASVMIFHQSRPRGLTIFPLRPKSPPAAMRWRTSHPLLAGLPEGVILSWMRGNQTAGGTLDAMSLATDQPVLEVAFWPFEPTGELPASVDALLAVRKLGRGRIVFCQLPLGAWDADPRSQAFLAGAVEYLLSPPQDILPLNQRRDQSKSALLPAATTQPGPEPKGIEP